MTAKMSDDVIGTDESAWKQPNRMWQVIDGEAIFEWVQSIYMNPTRDGLISISLEVKLHTQTEWLPVTGHGYARIRNVGEMPELDWKWIPPRLYPLVRLIPKRFRRSRTEW